MPDRASANNVKPKDRFSTSQDGQHGHGQGKADNRSAEPDRQVASAIGLTRLNGGQCPRRGLTGKESTVAQKTGDDVAFGSRHASTGIPTGYPIVRQAVQDMYRCRTTISEPRSQRLTRSGIQVGWNETGGAIVSADPTCAGEPRVLRLQVTIAETDRPTRRHVFAIPAGHNTFVCKTTQAGFLTNAEYDSLNSAFTHLN